MADDFLHETARPVAEGMTQQSGGRAKRAGYVYDKREYEIDRRKAVAKFRRHAYNRAIPTHMLLAAAHDGVVDVWWEDTTHAPLHVITLRHQSPGKR